MFSKPGLTTPVICVPSQSMMTVTSVRAFGPFPRSPCHEPTTGCPSCAASDAVATTHAMRTSRRPVLTSIVVFLPSRMEAVAVARMIDRHGSEGRLVTVQRVGDEPDPEPPRIVVVQNWQEELKCLVPTP